MKTRAVVLAVVAVVSSLAAAQAPKPDPWQPVRFMVGRWQGTASGESGTGTVERTYQFILNDRFIEERNTSTYKGEVHRHLSIISHDRKRQTLMLRQFHEESFVNLYALNAALSAPGKLVFDSESFENFDNSWKARETYEVLSADEFVETFELAPPGKPFEVYSRNHFKRVK